MCKESNKAWGGAREGAGRKKKYAKTFFFSATQDVADILDSVEGNRSDFINRAIAAYAAHDDRPSR